MLNVGDQTLFNKSFFSPVIQSIGENKDVDKYSKGNVKNLKNQ